MLAIWPTAHQQDIVDELGFLVGFQPLDGSFDTFELTRNQQSVRVQLFVIREVSGAELQVGSPAQKAIETIKFLIGLNEQSCLVIINGIGPEEKATQDDGSQVRMGQYGAFLSPIEGQSWPPTVMNIWIDATWCNGGGYFIPKLDGSLDAIPLHVMLIHELFHAEAICGGQYPDMKPDEATLEMDVMQSENEYRSEGHEIPPLSQRETFGVVTPCPEPPKPPPKPMDANPGCGPGPWWSYREDFKYPTLGGDINNPDPEKNTVQDRLWFYSGEGHFFDEIFEHNFFAPSGATPSLLGRLGQYSPPQLSEARTRSWFAMMESSIRMRAGEELVEPSDAIFNNRDSGYYAGDCPKPPGRKCLVAESHPSGRDSITLNELRVLRDKVLCETPWGRALFDRFHRHYYSFSGEVAARLAADPEMRESIGFMIATPLINYLRLATRLPRFEPSQLESVPSPFREFLGSIFGDLDQWLDHIDVGADPAGLAPEAAAIEIAVALKFRFRTQLLRDQYLSGLACKGLLPLRTGEKELESIASTMRILGASEDEVTKVLGRPRTAALPEAGLR